MESVLLFLVVSSHCCRMDETLYKINQNEKFGRYMVASKNLKQGQIILKENPLFLCPPTGGRPICFNCCSQIQKPYFCPECPAMLCNPDCKGRFHAPSECATLKSLFVKREDLITNPEIIATLRLLLWRQYDKNLFDRFLQLESHLQARRDTQMWRRVRINVEEVLYGLKLIDGDDLKGEIVQKICATLDTNSFDVRQPRMRGENLRGVFLEAAMMAHECVGNVHLAVDDDFGMVVRAAVDIPEGCPIFFNYTNPLQGNEERRLRLKEHKSFKCSCSRCTDPAELGTELSTLKCPRCQKGFLRPKSWQCSSCRHIYSSSLIKTTLLECRRRIDDINSPTIDNVEEILTKLSFTFHPHHYLVLELEQTLVQLYTQAPPLVKNLRRKIELCHKFLEIFQKVAPGISRIQAVALYELHSAIVNLAQKTHHSKEVTKEELLKMLLLAENNLKTSINYLLYEPKKSPEGRLAQNALSELKILRGSIKKLQTQ